MDVGTLGKGIKLGTINILVWVMGFMSNGYATEEFEVLSRFVQFYYFWDAVEESHDVVKTDLISLTG